MRRSEQLDQLLPALLAVQKELKPAIKDQANEHFGSKYADLASVVEASRPLLVANDLVVTQAIGLDYHSDPIGTQVLDTYLLHATSGQFIASTYRLVPTKPGPQPFGSEVTYARRYAYAALIGVVTEDDDGNSAQPEEKKRTVRTAPVTRPAIESPTNGYTVKIDGVEYLTGGCTELQLKALLALATFHGKPALLAACNKIGVDKPTACSEAEAQQLIDSFAVAP